MFIGSRVLPCLVIALLHSSLGLAQESSGADKASNARLMVTLKEYRVGMDFPEDISSREIVDRLLKDTRKPARTIRIPTLSDCESIFRTGEQVHVPQTSDKSKEPNFIEVGTTLRVTAKRESDAVLMQFDYSTSRLSERAAVGSIPSVEETTAQGTYLFKLGEPSLVSGMTADGAIYLVVTVSEPY